MIVYFYFIMLSTHWGHIALLPAAWSKLIGNVHVWRGGSHATVAQSQVSDNMHYDRLLLCFVITLIFFFWFVTLLAFDSRWWLHRVEEESDGSWRRFRFVRGEKNFSSRAIMNNITRVIEVRDDSSCDLDCFNDYTRIAQSRKRSFCFVSS